MNIPFLLNPKTGEMSLFGRIAVSVLGALAFIAFCSLTLPGFSTFIKLSITDAH